MAYSIKQQNDSKMTANLRVRFNAKKYNVWTEKIDPKRKSDGWLSGDWISNGKLYYGHPLMVFFLSSQNDWFSKTELSNKIK